MAHSPEITALDERLELVGQRIDRQYERRWTAILPVIDDLLSLNPISLIESLFGGGSVRDVDLRIADLEVRVSDLIRRRAEVMVQLHDQVTDWVLEAERSDRRLALLETQLAAHQQRVAVMEAGYRTGEGSTEQMITLWQQTENLQARLVEEQVSREQSIRKLLELTGYDEAMEQLDTPGGDRPDGRSDETLGSVPPSQG